MHERALVRVGPELLVGADDLAFTVGHDARVDVPIPPLLVVRAPDDVAAEARSQALDPGLIGAARSPQVEMLGQEHDIVGPELTRIRLRQPRHDAEVVRVAFVGKLGLNEKKLQGGCQ